ncbi:MAG: UDP-glucose 4-epimerase GalE [Alphaproteobacteria bacterium]
MRNVLVTGGAGYVGSHACKRIASAGFTPVVYDNLCSGHRWAVQWGPLEEGDVGDRARLDTVFATYRPVAVMHFAGLIQVGESVAKPALYYQNNVAATLVLLDAMLAHDVKRIVFSSSAAVYGEPHSVPIDEASAKEPINPYGVTKRLAEQIFDDYGSAYGLRHVSLRYFNAAGADLDGEIGEGHDPETHLIPIILQVASGQRESFDIFGTDYPTPDGTAVRDYIHVSDLADAHLAALEYLLADGASVCLNLGTGAGHSVREVVAAAEKVCGGGIAVREMPRRAGDPPALVAAAERVREVLGWRPQRSDLAQIVDSAWRWHNRER